MFSWGRNKPSDNGDWSLLSARDLLEQIRDKVYAQCGDSDPNPQKVELCGNLNNLILALDTFQLQECNGTNIGPLQNVLKTVVLNKQVAKICNVDELAVAIASAMSTGTATLYNKPDCILINPEQSYTVNAGSVHSLSYKIFGGDGTLQIGTGATIPIISGESDGWEATTTLSQAFTFTATGGTIKLILVKA